RTPEAEAFRHPAAGGWQTLTWRDTDWRVRAIACGLRALGLAAEERCAILSSTRLEWILSDLAILCAGGATTTLYPSSTGEECAFILSDSGSAFAFVEDVGQLAKLVSRRGELPALRRVIVLEGAVADDGFTLSLAALEALGRADEAAHPGGFEQTAEAVPPEALATLVYTSGTTGRPKGVELTHAGWVAQAEAVDAARILDHPEPLQLFWLPLAHVFGKMIGTAQLRIGFPTAVDGRLEKLVENFATVRPTFVCAVPRIFEKVHQRIVLQARAGGAVKRAVFAWAVGIGRQRAQVLREGGSPSSLLAASWAVADRLVLRKVRALFGGRLRFFVSGSAPLSREVAELFEAAGVMILEGYGLTESAAATHVDLPYRHRPGTVGPPLPGVEVKLADDGEVLMRCPWIMRGYHGQPDLSAEALQDGWLHTGDVGAADADGHLTLTDRKKDLIKTSGGKYVAPQELEGRLKALSPLVSQVLVHGDRRTYVTALVTLESAALSAWAMREGMSGRGAGALVGHPALRAELQRAFDLLNAGLPRFATVKKFAVLPAEFSEVAGEVTPSQKLKRKLIEQRYRDALDALYGEPARLP
ncbi:MAG TPA: long-chain fatty acid--CoA ligase, partial [Anaeromyxobacteraceae bacterium]